MKPTPKISIIVPVYKVEKYLRRCLDSIVAQTFTDWECILIDDGSPDGSGKICDEYAETDSRFKVIHQENKGVSAARNAGIDMAKGEWVTFVDSDDWMDVEMLLELHSVAKKHDADVVVSGITEWNESLQKRRKFSQKVGQLDMPQDIEWYMQAPWAKLYNRMFLEKYHIRFPIGIALAEDLYFNFLVFFFSCKVWGYNSTMYNYYRNQTSVTRMVTLDMIYDIVEVVKRMEVVISENKGLENWQQFLIQRKMKAKNYFLLSLDPIRCDLWRKIFPEVNLYSLRTGSVLKRFVYFSLLVRADYITSKIVRLYKGSR